MSREVGQWDLEVGAVFSLSPLILSCHWKMSNAIKEGEMMSKREGRWGRGVGENSNRRGEERKKTKTRQETG